VSTDFTETRVGLALEQLDVALDLFLEKCSYVSALTLAGAAEEILGKALKRQNRGHALDEWYDQVNDVWGVPRKEYIDKTNAARNAAKHLSSQEEMTVDFDVEWEAVWLLVRACENAKRLGYEETERMYQFNEWFSGEFIGV